MNIKIPIIYGLINKCGHLFYVGKTLYPKARFSAHRRKYGNCRFIELEKSSSSQADDAERHWISYLRFIGCELKNIREGGTGKLHICRLCHFEWYSMVVYPRACPRCKSYAWREKVAARPVVCEEPVFNPDEEVR